MNKTRFHITGLLVIGFLLGPGLGAAELPETHQLDGYTTFFDLEKKPAAQAGEDLAVKDHENGLKRILVYGLRGGVTDVDALLAERYEIYHVPIAGCIVSEGLLSGAEAYNQKMKALLLETYGKDVFREVEKELQNRGAQ